MSNTMKDSGIEWLNLIPSDWELRKWRNILTERNEKNDKLETKEVLSLGYNYGLIPASEKEYSGGNKPREDLSGYKIVRPNDIVMNSMNIVCGSVDISKYTGCVSPVYYAFYTKENEPKYFSYLFKSEPFELSLLGLGNGILIKETESGKLVSVRLRIPVDKLKPLLLPLPPLTIQKKIAAFLDKKCSDIDSVLSKTKESIEEYKLLKNAIITQAVTKGIHPNRKMKNSGIEWIGEIPEEWEVCKLKPFLKWKSIKGYGNETVLSLYRDYGVLPKDSRDDNYNVTSLDTDSYKLVEVGDFVINKMKAWQGSMAISNYRGIVSPAYHICSIESNKIHKPYFHHLMRNKSYLPEYERLSGGLRIGQWDLAFEDFCQIKFLIPSLEEQKEIAAYVDKKCSEIDILITKKEQLITELETYKKSLIYEYVTGKKEVQ